MTIYQKLIKRGLDIFFAVLLLILLLPLLLVLALLVRLFIGKRVIFKQARLGYNNKIFILYKFKTMTEQKDNSGLLLSDELRLTKLGKILRAASLDELPELWNVLQGNMSFVGPRPLLAEYLPLYNEEQSRRHRVRPGITGWAQINGRNSISWTDKFKLDCWYVGHYSFWFDIKILWLTFFKVMMRHGVSQEGQATMEKFNGQN
jgi:lipopolysaccharide/colanic/teichoic acid biosynthesis glycosyltransferase